MNTEPASSLLLIKVITKYMIPILILAVCIIYTLSAKAKSENIDAEYIFTVDEGMQELSSDYLKDKKLIKEDTTLSVIKELFGETITVDKTKSPEENIEYLKDIIADDSDSAKKFGAYRQLYNIYGVEADSEEKGFVLGIVAEMTVNGKIEYLGIYDGNAIYVNGIGQAKTFEYDNNEDFELTNLILNIMSRSDIIVENMGTNRKERMHDLPEGFIRLTFLTPGGITCGMGTYSIMRNDEISGGLIQDIEKLLSIIINSKN